MDKPASQQNEAVGEADLGEGLSEPLVEDWMDRNRDALNASLKIVYASLEEGEGELWDIEETIRRGQERLGLRHPPS